MHKCTSRLSSERICEILSKNYFFVQMGQDALLPLISKLWQYELEPGEVLLQEGKIDANIYLIIGGRVRITKEIDGKQVTTNELGAGEIVGLHSFLAGIKCTATVTAIRKTRILIITKDIFNTHIANHPASMQEISSIAIKQALGNKDSTFKSKHAYNITIIPGGNYQGLNHFIDAMKDEMSTNDSYLFLDEAFILSNGLFNIDKIDDSSVDEIIYQLESLEERYAYLIYVASAEFNPWTRICIRMAHRIVALAEESNDSSLNQTESAIFSEWVDIHAAKQLVLIHHSDKKYATHSETWTYHRGLDTVFNIREGNKNDMNRFIRDITNRSVAIVLSGGGARGFAHLGVIRAIEELGIKIDYVSGTSMGAVFSAFIAMELTYDHLCTELAKTITSHHSIIDFTIPTHALSAGHKINHVLQHFLTKDVAIEHLWRPSFYVATDLSNGQLAILNRGSLWKAVRASASLPGIFPPVTDDSGRILVDGAILNNLPVDIMSNYLHDSVHGHGRIIAVSIETIDSNFRYRGTYPQESHSFLSKLKSKIGGKKLDEQPDLPNIFHTISKSMMIASEQHLRQMEKHATFTMTINPRNYDLLDFKNIQKVIDIGYTTAIAQLGRIAKDL